MHDDQHGTAIIAGAGLMNAVQLSGKVMSKVRVWLGPAHG
jgi:malate dehydrogenase (oxaloacetate-decarboxylating)(NADP+)